MTGRPEHPETETPLAAEANAAARAAAEAGGEFARPGEALPPPRG